MNKSLKIILIEIITIKVNIIKIYTKSIHINTKESKNVWVYISLLENKQLGAFSVNLILDTTFVC